MRVPMACATGIPGRHFAPPLAAGGRQPTATRSAAKLGTLVTLVTWGTPGRSSASRNRLARLAPDVVVRPRAAAEVSAGRPGGDGGKPDAHHDAGPGTVR